MRALTGLSMEVSRYVKLLREKMVGRCLVVPDVEAFPALIVAAESTNTAALDRTTKLQCSAWPLVATLNLLIWQGVRDSLGMVIPSDVGYVRGAGYKVCSDSILCCCEPREVMM